MATAMEVAPASITTTVAMDIVTSRSTEATSISETTGVTVTTVGVTTMVGGRVPSAPTPAVMPACRAA